MKKRVLVAMSGGIDSTIAAYLLQKQGYDVVGVIMRIYDNLSGKNNTPHSIPIIERTKEIASELKIPLHIIDVQNIFDEKVIQYFISEYLEGKTPNPCIICNRDVKFEELLKTADAMNIGYVATGHYVQILSKNKKTNKRYLLKKGKDLLKDQSYMLYNLTQEQLSRCIFPLGKLKKRKVKKIAKRIGLDITNWEDSQDICFIENNDYGEFIQKGSKKEPVKGNIVDLQGNILGEHKGIHRYTVGQRKGVNTVSNKPLYVIKIDTVKNEIVVGEENEIYTKKLMAENLNWIAIEKLKNRMDVKAKIRYRSEDVPCTITKTKDGRGVIVEFRKPQRAATPGQSVVFYNRDIVIGGGVIQK